MKNLNKLLALVLALMMCLSLAACGGSNDSAAAPAAENEGAAEAAPAEGGESAESGEAAETAEGGSYTIGICQLVQHDALDAATNGFKQAVIDGLGEGNVTFDEQNAQGDSATCSTIVTGFVANGYDLIMANATPAVQAAVSATDTIPILGTSVTDYGAAIDDADMDPAAGTGINLSGTSDGVPAQSYVDLLDELLPEAKNVSVLYCSAEANSVLQAEQFKAAAEAEGKNVTIYTFADSNDIQSVVNSAVTDADALYIPTDNTAASNMTIISSVCEGVQMPIICGEENMMANGGLATVSISYYDIGYECGQQAVEILAGGADVSTMPIGYATDPVKEYNPVYAEAIGFTVPEGFTAYTPAA